jgi:hypothetical protein
MSGEPLRAPSRDHNPQFPDQFREAEEELRRIRRQIPTDRKLPPAVGVGLSGGGIRSATFCLGVFQALSRRNLLPSIDYLSTVSGGGYFGSFLGRLFTRTQVKTTDDVATALDGTPGDPGANPLRGVVSWLRESGRYLSPRGAGDMVLMLAGTLRNWFALHVTFVSVVVCAAFTIVLIREIVERSTASLQFNKLVQSLPLSSTWALWLSPVWLLAAASFALWAFPTGWAYWFLESPQPESFWRRSRWSLQWALTIVGLASFVTWMFFRSGSSFSRPVGWDRPNQAMLMFVLVAAAITLAVRLTRHTKLLKSPVQLPPLVGILCVIVLIYWLAALGLALAALLAFVILLLACFSWACASLWTERENGRVYADALARQRLTTWLKYGLIATAAFAGLTLVDSFGESLYRGGRFGGAGGDRTWLAALTSILAVAGAPAARILPVLLGGRKKPRSTPFLNALLIAVALLLVTATLSLAFWLAHATRWSFGPTPQPPAGCPSPCDLTSELVSEPQRIQLTVTRVPETRQPRGEAGQSEIMWLALGAAISLLFALLFGATWTFLNNSSQLAFYKARLARAYLGASNERRLKAVQDETDGEGDLREVVPEDDLDLLDYFGVPRWEKGSRLPPNTTPFVSGAPLHLINVTINETTGGRSQVQQQDRKGLAMCLGPCGLSAGTDDHVVFDRSELRGAAPAFGQESGPWVRLRHPANPNATRFFLEPQNRGQTQWLTLEPLTLGHWTAISGAAFSTGTGYRTSFGLSYLAGFGNVRLGYWWDSRHLKVRWKGSWPSRVFRRALAVQAFLIQEFFAQFPGTSRRHWYLSDGGHFENLAGYELLRRRLPWIVLFDAEADPGFEFEGLASLVRRARIDFGAEIHFLTRDELDKLDPKPPRGTIGALEELKRGRWEHDPGPFSPADDATRTLAESDPLRYSHVHAALAVATYPGTTEWSLLVYVKASMTGDEPLDLRQYHREHGAFPHEPTSDQFFDEAQWESYRKLGEHVADVVFRTPRSEWNPSGPDLPKSKSWVDLVARLQADRQRSANIGNIEEAK